MKKTVVFAVVLILLATVVTADVWDGFRNVFGNFNDFLTGGYRNVEAFLGFFLMFFLFFAVIYVSLLKTTMKDFKRPALVVAFSVAFISAFTIVSQWGFSFEKIKWVVLVVAFIMLVLILYALLLKLMPNHKGWAFFLAFLIALILLLWLMNVLSDGFGFDWPWSSTSFGRLSWPNFGGIPDLGGDSSGSTTTTTTTTPTVTGGDDEGSFWTSSPVLGIGIALALILGGMGAGKGIGWYRDRKQRKKDEAKKPGDDEDTPPEEEDEQPPSEPPEVTERFLELLKFKKKARLRIQSMKTLISENDMKRLTKVIKNFNKLKATTEMDSIYNMDPDSERFEKIEKERKYIQAFIGHVSHFELELEKLVRLEASNRIILKQELALITSILNRAKVPENNGEKFWASLPFNEGTRVKKILNDMIELMEKITPIAEEFVEHTTKFGLAAGEAQARLSPEKEAVKKRREKIWDDMKARDETNLLEHFRWFMKWLQPILDDVTKQIQLLKLFDEYLVQMKEFEARIIVEPPLFGSMNLASGPASGGDPVTITGENFTSDTNVWFGENNAIVDINVESPVKITGKTPRHAPGRVDVIVYNNKASSIDRGEFYFTSATGPAPPPPRFTRLPRRRAILGPRATGSATDPRATTEDAATTTTVDPTEDAAATTEDPVATATDPASLRTPVPHDAYVDPNATPPVYDPAVMVEKIEVFPFGYRTRPTSSGPTRYSIIEPGRQITPNFETTTGRFYIDNVTLTVNETSKFRFRVRAIQGKGIYRIAYFIMYQTPTRWYQVHDEDVGNWHLGASVRSDESNDPGIPVGRIGSAIIGAETIRSARGKKYITVQVTPPRAASLVAIGVQVTLETATDRNFATGMAYFKFRFVR